MTVQFSHCVEVLVFQFTSISHVAFCAGVCVVSGCVASQRHTCKLLSVERLWLSQCTGWCRCCGVGQTLVALPWTWHFCVALRRHQSWLPWFPFFRLGRIWKDLLMLVQQIDGEVLAEVGLSLFFLRRTSSHLYLAKHFEHLVHDCEFEVRLPRNMRGIFSGSHNVQAFATLPSLHQSH